MQEVPCWTPGKRGSYNEKVKPRGRILAIDFGAKNLGLAATDPTGTIVQSLPTLRRRQKRADLERLRELATALGAERIVVGHPLHLKGYAGARAQEAERFAAWLGRELKLPVELFDERLTSWEADELLRKRGASPKERKESADRVAAALLLEAYLAHLAEAAKP
jgi:putative Holliday junction resolvase